VSKASRAEQQRRNALAQNRLRNLVQQFERQSLLDLVGAALCSPTAAHQMPALTNVRSLALSMEGGIRLATAADLPLLTAAAHKSQPMLSSITDQVPKDPRIPVEFRRGDRMYRVHPENMERPMAVLWKAEVIAAVIDDALFANEGFGMGDYLDLSLSYMDAGVRALFPTWTDGPPADPRDPGKVGEQEIAAYRTIPELDELVAGCSRPNAARLALRSATLNAAEVAAVGDNPLHRFRSAMAVRTEDGAVVREPPSQVCAAIDFASLELAAVAVGHRPELEDEFFEVACEQVARRLRRLNFTFVPNVQGPGRASATMLVQLAEKTFVTVNVVSNLDGSQFSFSEEAEDLLALQPGQAVRSHGFGRTIPSDARIARLIVFVSPAHIAVPSGGGVAGMSLEDLDWITTELSETPDDFWWFVRDLGNPPGMGRLMNWESIDAFEHWRTNRSFWISGVRPELVMIEPHWADAEYIQALAFQPVETALLLCGEPPIRSFDDFSRTGDGDGDALLYNHANAQGVRVLLHELPICLELTMATYPPEGALWAENVSSGIAWKLEHMPPLSWLHARFGLTGLVIATEWHDGPAAGRQSGPQRVAITISHEALTLCQDNTPEFESQIAAAIVDGLAQLCGVSAQDTDLEHFSAAWHEASAGIRMDLYEVWQVETFPPSPEEISGPARKQYEHAINRHLLEAGIEPGRFSNEAARDLESKIVAPMLLSMLHDQLAAFDGRALLGRALRQYDLANAKRINGERKLSFTQRFDEFTLDPAAAYQDLVEESMRLTRAETILIEELLVQEPAGTEVPDRMQWTELLALADILFEAQMRSEAIHFNLSNTELVVTDSYDVQIDSSGGSGWDVEGFTAAHVDGTKIGPRLPHEAEPRTASEEEQTSDGEDEMLPILDAVVDEALLDAMGFRALTILQVLYALTHWPEQVENPPSWASEDQLVEFCDEQITIADRDEIRAAVGWLELTHAILGDDPLEHWEQDRRDARVLVRPLVRYSDGLIAVLPWAIQSTLRVFTRHLSDGRLPWPRRIVPPAVQAAVDAYRQRRNEDLEDDVYGQVVELGYKSRKRVKKARVLGLVTLRSEIDVIVANEVTGHIWVLEVKDPHEPFSQHQIRNGIDEFVGTPSRTGYVAKLATKVADVTADPDAVASALGCGTPATPWVVKGAMVTRRPVPAAFAGTGVPFVTPETLPTLLASGSED
jgi:hypothetical protein